MNRKVTMLDLCASARVGLRVLTLALLLTFTSVQAAVFDFAVNVPARLGGTDYLPEQVVRSTAGSYSSVVSFPAKTHVLSLHRKTDGVWLFSVAHPATLGGADYEPRDLVTYDGVSYALFLDGSSVGIPSGARIDALLLDSLGRPVMSFDVPVTLAGNDFSRSDLVTYNSGFDGFWDAEGAGVPVGTNVVGAALDASGSLVLGFDVPTRLGTTDYLPGELVAWSGTGFSSYARDPSWPAHSQMRDFAFLPGAGAVPDGNNVPGPQLHVSKATGSDLLVSWAASCVPSDTDYEVYEPDSRAFARNPDKKLGAPRGRVESDAEHPGTEIELSMVQACPFMSVVRGMLRQPHW